LNLDELKKVKYIRNLKDYENKLIYTVDIVVVFSLVTLIWVIETFKKEESIWKE